MQYGLPLEETVPSLRPCSRSRCPRALRALTVSPERQKQQTLHALLTILLRIAAQQPVLFVIEDLHWVDSHHAGTAQAPGGSGSRHADSSPCSPVGPTSAPLDGALHFSPR